MTHVFSLATDEIAKRFNRRMRFTNPWHGLDGQNVRDHAYRKVSRCTTIRLIAAGESKNSSYDTVVDDEVEDDGFVTVHCSSNYPKDA